VLRGGEGGGGEGGGEEGELGMERTSKYDRLYCSAFCVDGGGMVHALVGIRAKNATTTLQHIVVLAPIGLWRKG
jgi:hypothetical protein